MIWFACLLCAGIPSAYPIPVAHAESLWVTEVGQGPPVVLIPGLFGSAYGFRRVTSALAESGYRAIVIEPLGIGHSAKPEKANYSLTAQANRLAAVLDQLHTEPAIVVAHSVGASMAFRLAYHRPDLVRGVISLEGGPAEAAATRSFRRAVRVVPWVKWLGGIKVIRKKIRGELIKASADTTWITDEVVDGYTAGAKANLDGTLLAFLGMAVAREPEKLAPRLGDIACPVRLLLGGTPHSGLPSANEVQTLLQGITTFAVDTVPRVGHYIHEERPEAILAALGRVAAMTQRAGR